jgi:hypothetical protein
MNFRFHPEALQEFEQAVLYYEERQAGLGERFAVALRVCFPMPYFTQNSRIMCLLWQSCIATGIPVIGEFASSRARNDWLAADGAIASFPSNPFRFSLDADCAPQLKAGVRRLFNQPSE